MFLRIDSPPGMCLFGAVAKGTARESIGKTVSDKRGQATVEAAFLIPLMLGGVLLLAQPGILLYDRIVMQGAAAEACRLLAVTPEGDGDGSCEDFILRRLGAVPQQDLFHVHEGGCTWVVSLEGGESAAEVAVSISTEAKPLPLVGFAGGVLGLTNENGNFVVSVTHRMPTQPAWVRDAALGGGPGAWIGAWAA